MFYALAENTPEKPLAEFTFQGEKYPTWGNPKGHAKTAEYDIGKFNRFAKLGAIADEIITKFTHMLDDPMRPESRCAYACLLMMLYGIRVGNEDSAEGYISGVKETEGEFVQTYGTTTLLKQHITLQGDALYLDFSGKRQVHHNIKVSEPMLVKIGRTYKQGMPTEKWIGIDYDMLFKFIKTHIGKDFVPKDTRTFCANITCWGIMKQYLDAKPHAKASDANKEIAEIVEVVAHRLGNTPGIAKKAYLDARLIEWFKGQRFQAEKP